MGTIDRIDEIRELLAVSKQRLSYLIDNKSNLLDPDVILLSQLVDDIISEYYKYMEKIKIEDLEGKFK